MKALLRFFGLSDAPEPEAPEVPELEAVPTTIGPGIRIKGEIGGEGALTLHGHFEGDIALHGDLHVGPEARVDANISASTIVIAGMVRGNLSADTRVEILATGSLTGTVKSGSFAAAEGATVKGEVWVERRSPARATVAAPAS